MTQDTKDPEALKDPRFAYELICRSEEIQIEGNCMASGDDEYDDEVAAKIHADLDAGNQWAWAAVTLRCTYKGLETTDHLGCCSYSSESDFKAGGYYTDMISTVTDEMKDLISAIVSDNR